MKISPDVLVIGGGVIGLTTAYFLAREGCRVRIVDRGDLGQEASWAGAGILPPGNPKTARTPFDLLRAHSTAMFPTLVEELRERTHIDNGYWRCGGLEFLDEHEAAAAEQEWRGEGIVCELVDRAGLQRLEPELAPHLTQAYYLPEMAQLRNPRHIKALIAGCQSWGVELQPGCAVHGFDVQEGRVLGILTNQGRLQAGQVIICSGAWTGGLMEALGWRLGIKPIRGQIALLRTNAALVRQVLMFGSRYLVPRPDGRVLVGSTEEDAGFDKHTTGQAIHDLLELAFSLVPALGQAHLERCWAGLRPGSPDGLPILGRMPDLENLFLAAGHFRAGIQLSPGTGLVMKELLLGQPLTIPLEAFSIERFGGKRVSNCGTALIE
jgi:glycine oxidase